MLYSSTIQSRKAIWPKSSQWVCVPFRVRGMRRVLCASRATFCVVPLRDPGESGAKVFQAQLGIAVGKPALLDCTAHFQLR